MLYLKTDYYYYVEQKTTLDIIIICIMSIFFQDESRVWTAASQQHKVDNQPSVTRPFWDLPISRVDTFLRKSRLVTIRQQSIQWNVGTTFWWLDILSFLTKPLRYMTENVVTSDSSRTLWSRKSRQSYETPFTRWANRTRCT